MPRKQTQKKVTLFKQHVHKRVKLAVVPHKANQFRPRAVGRYGIAIIVLLVLLSQGAYNGITGRGVLGTEAQVTASGLLTATNKAREDQGIAPLAINNKLVDAAQLKVQDMFAKQYWDHTAPDGATPWHWFGEVKYIYSDAGENLAKNFTTSNGAVDAWLASPTHRENLLKSSYKDVGFAVMSGALNGKPTTLIVALYGTLGVSAVQGTAHTQAPGVDVAMGPMERLGMGVKALTPVAVVSVIVLLLAANIALLAHMYRTKLPVRLRRSLYRHHGIYKAIGFSSLAVILVFAYGSVGMI